MLRARVMEEIAAELGGHVNPHYSGRGMYGETCPAIIIPSEASSLMLLGAYLADLVGMDDGGDMIRRARTDSMGLDTVVYFPGVVFDDGDDTFSETVAY